MKITQIETYCVINAGEAANATLRAFQKEYPKRKIINVNMISATPAGWFMTIVYEVEV